MAAAAAAAVAVPRAQTSSVLDTLEKFKRDDAFSRFGHAYFASDTRRMRDFFVSFFGTVTVIESHQQTFHERFDDFLARWHVKPEVVTPERAGEIMAKGTGWIVSHASAASNKCGLMSLNYFHGIQWIFELYVLEDTQIVARTRSTEAAGIVRRKPFGSILELPRSHVFPLLDRAERAKFPAFGTALLQHLGLTHSKDASRWWERLAVGVDQFLYADDHILRHYEDNLTDGTLQARTLMDQRATQTLVTAKPPPPPSSSSSSSSLNRAATPEASIFEPGRLAMTAYLFFVSTMLSERPPDCVDDKKFPATALFPLFIDFLTGDLVTPLNRFILDIYDADEGRTLRYISFLAEEFRAFVGVAQEQHNNNNNKSSPSPPIAAESAERQKNLRRLYARTLDSYQALKTYRDTRRVMFTERRLCANMRLVFCQATHVSLGTFLQQLDEQLLSGEQQALGAWLESCLPRHFTVNLLDLRRAASVETAADKPAAARAILKHLVDCERRLVVLRFAPNIRHYEVELSLDFVRQLYPKLFEIHSHAGDPLAATTTCSEWCSSQFFLGLDGHGPYLVILRSTLEILRQVNLCIAMHTERFRKNMPVFPMLARFYFSRVSDEELSKNTSVVADVQTSVADNAQEQSQSPSSSSSQTITTELEEYNRVDDHALHCMVQILARWLGLPTEHSQIIHQGGVGGGLGGNNNNNNNARRNKRRRVCTGGYQSAHETCTPEFGGNFFPCMRMLHRFAHQLSEAALATKSEFLSMRSLDSLAGYLEMFRRRCVHRSLLERALKELETSPKLTATAAHTDAIKLLHMLLTDPQYHMAKPFENENKKRTASAPAAAAATSSSSSSSSSLDWILLDNLHPKGEEDEQNCVALCNWLILYVPVINSVYSPQLLHDLFLGGPPGVVVQGREAISETTFSSYSTSTKAHKYGSTSPKFCQSFLAEVYSKYLNIFVVPYTHSRRRLAKEFADIREPMQSLVDWMRYLESCVSCESIGKLLQENMGPETFDLGVFFAERNRPEPPPDSGLPHISADGRSILPIQAWGSRALEFTFYETSFPLMVASGTEYIRFLRAHEHVDEAVIAEEARTANNGSAKPLMDRSDDALPSLIDVMLRYAPRLEPQIITANHLRLQSWDRFVALLEKHVPRAPTQFGEKPYRDRSGLPRRFDSFAALRAYLVSIVSPATVTTSGLVPLTQLPQTFNSNTVQLIQWVCAQKVSAKGSQDDSAGESSPTSASATATASATSSSPASPTHNWTTQYNQLEFEKWYSAIESSSSAIASIFLAAQSRPKPPITSTAAATASIKPLTMPAAVAAAAGH